MFLSPQFTGAGLASILGNAQPLFIAIIAGIALGERLSKIQVLSLLLGISGVITIISPSFRAHDSNLLTGTLVALLTSVSAAIGTVMGRFIRFGDYLFAFSGWQLLLSGGTLLSLSAISGEQGIEWNWAFTGILLFWGFSIRPLRTVHDFTSYKGKEPGNSGFICFSRQF